MYHQPLNFTTYDCIGNDGAGCGMFEMAWGSPVSENKREASRLAETPLIQGPQGRTRVTDRSFGHA
jgi:hypothetical protein